MLRRQLSLALRLHRTHYDERSYIAHVLSKVEFSTVDTSRSVGCAVEPAFAPDDPSMSSVRQRKASSQRALKFTSPYSKAVRRVKKLSVFSCGCALASGPVMLALEGPSTAVLSIAASLAGFGVFTTGLLHWFTHAYAHRVEYDPGTDVMTVETLNVLARPVQLRFQVGDVEPADGIHPLSNFKIPGGKMLYVDQDNFPDKQLLARLIPCSDLEQEPREGAETSRS